MALINTDMDIRKMPELHAAGFLGHAGDFSLTVWTEDPIAAQVYGTTLGRLQLMMTRSQADMLFRTLGTALGRKDPERL